MSVIRRALPIVTIAPDEQDCARRVYDVRSATPRTSTKEANYFSIPELADRWRCSRAMVYNIIRGERVLDFAAPGHKGKKLVPAEIVRRIEDRNTKVYR
jgi:hypothetical protein